MKVAEEWKGVIEETFPKHNSPTYHNITKNFHNLLLNITVILQAPIEIQSIKVIHKHITRK